MPNLTGRGEDVINEIRTPAGPVAPDGGPGSALADTSLTREAPVMEWWEWIFVILAALLFLTVMFYGVQVRRRRGGIVAQRTGRQK